MNKLKWLLLLLLPVAATAQRNQWADILNTRYTVQDTADITGTFFADMGAWHAYALPEDQYTTGFTGPLLMDMKGEWLSSCIARLRLYENGQALPLLQVDTATHYYPGMLQKTSQAGELQVVLQLIFSGAREAVLQTTIINNGSRPRTLQLQWEGVPALQRAVVHTDANNIRIGISGTAHQFDIHYLSTWNITSTNHGYQATKTMELPANGRVKEIQTQCYYLDPSEIPVHYTLPDTTLVFLHNAARWNDYLKKLFQRMPFTVSDTMRSRLAVKSMITLLTNWRSPAGKLLHGGLFPSISYQGFYGFWSWDSWKQAAGLSYFDTALAQNNIRALFDYQERTGMIPDCIYADSSENNHRDTKPPLAAWAVWEVFQASKDTAFLRSMYAPLCRYHAWWYTHRDHDGNGLCEYGSTDGTRIAAAWESGMDNAVRFDKAVMLQNNPGAWSLDQESVDLNSYLFKEKMILAQIALALQQPKAAQEWRLQAAALRLKINKAFYDTATGYYYDRKLHGELIRVKGAEGWIPLWSGVASETKMKAIALTLKDTAVFNTFVPLPVLDATEPAFDPQNGYWRGPVWIDQFYFAVAGLQAYGAKPLAAKLTARLWQNAAGMQGNGPLYENYHPQTGKGLNAPNFSWTAAHVLMLLATEQ
ncbi:putative isomerase [Chitinophaga niastensis]|uniref:Putative isomerase n=1 Tax=Chitinophaga niastensis TaxID=536980 RepID=A0A2P8HF80_CHINA|nr:trehalase family glycosidase [Chitinophaga niastensis]PSL44880.1 putative isomerase [Chitinophaga niastensis]